MSRTPDVVLRALTDAELIRRVDNDTKATARERELSSRLAMALKYIDDVETEIENTGQYELVFHPVH